MKEKEEKLPNVKLPHVKLPHVKLPHVKLPHVKLPHVKLPPTTLFNVNAVQFFSSIFYLFDKENISVYTACKCREF